MQRRTNDKANRPDHGGSRATRNPRLPIYCGRRPCARKPLAAARKTDSASSREDRQDSILNRPPVSSQSCSRFGPHNHVLGLRDAIRDSNIGPRATSEQEPSQQRAEDKESRAPRVRH